MCEFPKQELFYDPCNIYLGWDETVKKKKKKLVKSLD